MHRPDIAGKTGTTNDATDSWFTGYNGRLVTSVWAGFDQPESLGRREWGVTIALPIWMDYMTVALAGTPAYSQPEPDGIVRRRIAVQDARAASRSEMEVFRSDNVPPSDPSIDSSQGVPQTLQELF